MVDTVGLFMCRCRGEISNHLPLDKIVKEYSEKPDFVKIHLDDSLCDANQRTKIAELAEKYKLDGMVFAGCSPRYYEQYFREVASDVGINPGKVTFANLREQLAWVFKGQSEQFLLSKSRTAIDVARNSLNTTSDFLATKVNIKKSVAIVGGGIGGIQVALSITRAMPETEIHIIERNSFIGGNQLKYSKAFPRDECSSCAISPLISELSVAKNVTIHDKSEVVSCVGRVGDYEIEIKRTPRYVTDDCISCSKCSEVCPNTVFDPMNIEEHTAIHLPFKGTIPMKYNINNSEIKYCLEKCDQPCLDVCPTNAIDLSMDTSVSKEHVGAIVVATGAAVHKPSYDENQYGYGLNADVLTLHEYEMLLAATSKWKGRIYLQSDSNKSPKSIAFLLCVERSELGYCSKYCCLSTAASIRQTVEKLPDTKIYVFYQDQFADSKFGDEYIKATKKLSNVEWIRSTPRQIVTADSIKMIVPISGGNLELPVEMLILSTGMKPHASTPFLRHTFGLEASKEGFFREFDLLFSPVSTSDIGKFVIGTASGPKTIPETTISAYAAGSHVLNLLSKDLTLPVSITQVNEDLCSGCGVCVKTCAYHANSINLVSGVARVDITRCRGCGNCVTSCPAKARDLIEYSDATIRDSIEILSKSEKVDAPSILAFLCNGCGYSTADNVGLTGAGLTYSPNLSIIRVPCSGRVDARQMLEGLTKFDGVLIGACKLHSCLYSVGNFDAQKRVYLLQGTLAASGIDHERLMIEYYSPTEVEKFAEVIETFSERLAAKKKKIEVVHS